MDIAGKTERLFDDQLIEWNLAGQNYSMLAGVRTRTIDFGSYSVLVQYNPERIRSSAARVDAKSVGERPCFLCEDNRPPQQKGVATGSGLTVLVNPYPIFHRHLTIVSSEHTPQRISGRFTGMLEMAKMLNDYVIFYNGPQCGASAPDHFHFQAGNRRFLPIESDFIRGANIKLLTVWAGSEIFLWHGYGRGIATLRGTDPESLNAIFDSFRTKMERLQPNLPEPMMNILAYHEDSHYTVHLIPRRLHRPTQYFAVGSSQILLSPASVDLGGVLITPREEDFLKLDAETLEDIFSQVCFRDEQVMKLFDEFL